MSEDNLLQPDNEHHQDYSNPEHTHVDTAEQIGITAAESEHQQPKHQPEEHKHNEQDPLLRSLNALRQHVEQEAKSSKDIQRLDLDDDPSSAPTIMLHRELKDDAYRRSIQKAQTQLSAPDRALSKVIHQPTVELISNVTAQTVGRPSGLFMGGLLALISSSLLLYMARNYGFSYNYAVMLLGFLGGFIVGVVIEFGWRAMRRGDSL
jgi:hypothetical protein